MRGFMITALALAACAPEQSDWEGELAFPAAVADLAICEADDGSFSALLLAYTQRNCPRAGATFTSIENVTCENDALRVLQRRGCNLATETMEATAVGSLWLHSKGLHGMDELREHTFQETTWFGCDYVASGEPTGERHDIGATTTLIDFTPDGARLQVDHPDLQGEVAVRVCRGKADPPNVYE